jgi:hypothetical protein
MKRTVFAFSLLVFGAACTGSHDNTVSFPAGNASATESDDIAITTTDSSMVLAVRHDTLRARLSDKVRAKVGAELDTSKVKGDGFGASIEKFVKKSVNKGLGAEVSEPLSDFSDAKVENGTLLIIPKDKSKSQAFDRTKANNKPLMQSFSQADAENFAAYIRARLAKGF